MNVPLIAAATLALVSAGVHGAGGEILILRKLSPEMLPEAFGSRQATRRMIHIAWHMATVALLGVGGGLLWSGLALDGDAAYAVSLVAAAMMTGFVALVLGLRAGAPTRTKPWTMLHHPGPALLIITMGLAWWGVVVAGR